MKSTYHNKLTGYYNDEHYYISYFNNGIKSNSEIWIIYLMFTAILMMSTFYVKAPSISKSIDTKNLYPFINTDLIPSDSSILKELVKDKCVLASVAVAQARIESGNYTSDIAIHNKNLFGIKFHTCKYVTGERKGHATFATFKDNIACYCNIQKLYLNKINKAYAQDTLYCKKIKEMK